MPDPIPVTFELGVLRPLSPVELHVGDVVSVRIEPAARQVPESANNQPSSPIAELLAEAIGLPPEGDERDFSGADHDAVLYDKS